MIIPRKTNDVTLRFRRWSRKSYASFKTIGREVTIGKLSIDLNSLLLKKNKSNFNSMNTISNLASRVLEGKSLTYEEAIELSLHPEKEALYSAADTIRQHYFADQFDLCSIINARSGRCSEDCKWCSQSKHYKTNTDIYPLVSYETVQSQAISNQQAGVRKFSLVTSGRKLSPADLKQVNLQYRQLKEDTTLELCASMGLLDESELRDLHESGVRNYHCNIETAPSFFAHLCSTHTMEEKIETLQAARRVGMKLCSGGIIGMGETMEQRIEMAFTLQRLGIDSIPINLLNPIQGTPLENSRPLTDEEVLTTIALFRLINPKAWIRFAGGRTLMLHIQDKAMKAGINAALVGDLLTTVGVKMEEDIAHIKSLGFQC